MCRRAVAATAFCGVLVSMAGRAEAQLGCTITTTSVSFGAYNVYVPSPLDSTGTVTYTCGLGILGITIDLGKGSSSSFNPRTMTSGANTLNYNLYLDAARARIWGDNTAGTSHHANSSPQLLTNVTLTVYGRVPPLQDVRVGSYTDTVVVTITF